MQELVLSDGSVLELPDEMPDDQVRVMVNQAEAQLHPPETMTGDNPIPSDQSWFPENEPFPGYTIAHEGVAGALSTLADAPNWPVHMVNAGREAYDLHFGSGTGEVEPVAPFLGKGGVISEFDPKAEFDALNPQTPGWDRFRRNTGLGAATLAITRSPQAALAAPFLTEGAERLGDFADTSIDPNPDHKWARTLPLLAPTLSRATTFAARKVPSMATGAVADQLGGSASAGYLISNAAKAAIAAKRAVLPPPSLPQVLGQSVAPYAIERDQ